jgi:O-antigen/teichoic acid export membrane protein
MNMAFIPLYIKYLGIEAYGLIGVYAILQAWLGLLDMGMRPALGREMARFTSGAHDAHRERYASFLSASYSSDQHNLD